VRPPWAAESKAQQNEYFKQQGNFLPLNFKIFRQIEAKSINICVF
jgi:hypothetical protein